MAFKALAQAYDVQDFAYSALMALKAETQKDGKQQALSKDDAATLGTLGKVWRDAQEQIRIHRGKPLPGSLTHEKVKRGARAVRGPGASMLAERAAAEAEIAQSATSDATPDA